MSELSPLTDAYCHIGLPRFGSAEDALTVLARSGIERVVFVLGPGVPDYATLFGALRDYGERVRGIGIPFGATPAQVYEMVTLQLSAGVLGLRVTPEELLAYPEIRTLLGDQARWIYAIDPLASPEVIEALLAWLQCYPEARIAAPHFLTPGSLLTGKHDALTRELVGHARFYPIFSRHGGMGSRELYPHRDFHDWVHQVIDLAGWDHILWGSEYPVLYWRDESVATCQSWLAELLGISPASHVAVSKSRVAEMRAFLGGNAERVLFDVAPPRVKPVAIPKWVDAQFNRNRTVPLFPGGLDVPMALYARLHSRYVAVLQSKPDTQLSFADFVVRCLEEKVDLMDGQDA